MCIIMEKWGSFHTDGDQWPELWIQRKEVWWGNYKRKLMDRWEKPYHGQSNRRTKPPWRRPLGQVHSQEAGLCCANWTASNLWGRSQRLCLCESVCVWVGVADGGVLRHKRNRTHFPGTSILLSGKQSKYHC